jgi:hypothetical protein
MGSDDERHQRRSQYSLHRSRHRSPSQDTYANPSGPSRSRSHRRSDILPPRPHAPEDPSRLSGRLAAPNYPYPPSVFSEGHVPRRSPIRYSMAGKTQHELDEEDAAMRKEDRVNRKSRKEATGNKVFAEERSRSRRRSRRRSESAFINSRQLRGEGRYSGDERDCDTQERQGRTPPPPSRSGYYPRVSAYPDKTFVYRPCLSFTASHPRIWECKQHS